jgi:antitoxin MazE6
MKTAVSIPDALFKKGERLARRLKLSRSALYAKALDRFVRERDEDAMISRINEACEQVDTRIDPAWVRAQIAALPREDW